MIPVRLKIAGFLSYRDPVELDFSGFHLACIAGPNGAGKSSLLDAITWVLFGKARKNDESLINLHPSVKAAEVVLDFEYEGNLYRVQRVNPRGKTNLLEFAIQSAGGSWKQLTERSMRETQLRIEGTLRLDYETFINASFFLQGKADQFAQCKPNDRKRILSSILGLETWEDYRQKAAEQRRSTEEEIGYLDGRLAEIDKELKEEAERRERLKRLEEDLQTQMSLRSAQENSLEIARRAAAVLTEQEKAVAALARALDATERKQKDLHARLEVRRQERHIHQQSLAQAAAIEQAHLAWQQARQALEEMDGVAARFHLEEKRRQAPLLEIEAERARLKQALLELQRQADAASAAERSLESVEQRLIKLDSAVEQAQRNLSLRQTLQDRLAELKERQTKAETENPVLKTEMNKLKARIDALQEAEGVRCPTCGQPLSGSERIKLIAQIEEEGTEMGNRYRTNNIVISEGKEQLATVQAELDKLKNAENELLEQSRQQMQAEQELQRLRKDIQGWNLEGLPRQQALARSLEQDDFAEGARQRLGSIDAELRQIGYDAAGHDALRKAELHGRSSAAALNDLEKARAALAPLERELGELATQAAELDTEAASQRQEYDSAAASLAAAQAQAPDLYRLERELLRVQELENRLRAELGAARQEVEVLGTLKKRKGELTTQRATLATQVSRYKKLEAAFGNKGVPALLIEQALPQIEARANDILDRLSNGSMTVRFATQADYKGKREDKKETLDILISDGAGLRDYELYSGGEAFRVNFAIRLALSEVLAQRAGARLQTLVIDEGFGSQDAQGRQRLIEAINLVQDDFARILVITHIDELKDAFPNRIEVEKTERGSTLRLV